MPNTRNYFINKWTLSPNSISTNKRIVCLCVPHRKKRRKNNNKNVFIWYCLCCRLNRTEASLSVYVVFVGCSRLGQSEFKFYLFIYIYAVHGALLHIYISGVDPCEWEALCVCVDWLPDAWVWRESNRNIYMFYSAVNTPSSHVFIWCFAERSDATHKIYIDIYIFRG